MSLDKIQLPPSLIAELYKDCLIDLENGQRKEQSLNKTALPHLGGNQSHVLIINNEAGTPHCSDENLSLLMGILKACGLDMSHIALYNLAGKDPVDIHVLVAEFRPEKIIAFGSSASDLSLPVVFPLYQVQAIDNRTFLFAPELDLLQNNPEEKRNLWNALKKIFSLS